MLPVRSPRGQGIGLRKGPEARWQVVEVLYHRPTKEPNEIVELGLTNSHSKSEMKMCTIEAVRVKR